MPVYVSIDSMIKSIARCFNWVPSVFDSMYIDNIDYHGLHYWYTDCLEQEEELKNK